MRHAWGRQEDAGTPGKPSYLLLEYLRGLLLLPGFLSGSVVKNSPDNASDVDLSPDREDPLEQERATLQYSCLENAMDKGAWQATVHGVAKESDTT